LKNRRIKEFLAGFFRPNQGLAMGRAIDFSATHAASALGNMVCDGPHRMVSDGEHR
jgi:hypothetical protein